MSRLRVFPTKHRCQSELGKFDKGNPNYGVAPVECGEPAVIRCNACRKYFCEECWVDHLEMTVVERNGRLVFPQGNQHGSVVPFSQSGLGVGR